MPQLDYHILVKTKYQNLLCNKQGRAANNQIMNLTKTDLTKQQATQIKQEYLSNIEQQETEFVIALENHFDKQNALEIAESWQVSKKVINKHFKDYLDAIEEGNAEKAYNANFWTEFQSTAFSECLINKGVVTNTSIRDANESDLERYSQHYITEAKKHYQQMLDVVDQHGTSYREQADYAFAKVKFSRMAELYWMCERRLGRK